LAINQEYFDAINIDVVKKKYYNANKVNAVFNEIREHVLALNAENEQLNNQLHQLSDKKAEIGESILSAKVVAQEIIQEAREQANEIIAKAQKEKEELMAQFEERQNYAVQRLRDCYDRMKEQQQTILDEMESDWQDFLCRLYPEPEMAEPAPEDLRLKVEAIAFEMFDMDSMDEAKEVSDK